jgi:putative cardiolipin synthase
MTNAWAVIQNMRSGHVEAADDGALTGPDRAGAGAFARAFARASARAWAGASVNVWVNARGNDTQARPGWMSVWSRLARWAGLLLLLGGLGACASLPPQTPRAPSTAVAASTLTALGRIAADSSPDASLSGFRLLPIGAFAIDTRLALIGRAQQTIDVQYYLIQDDETGRYLLRSLRDAALRGVRVRLLIDDLFTAGIDPLLLGLAAHPNVEIHLFNPFPAGRGHLFTRFLLSARDFKRVNRRMHNKLLIVDGAMAVTGGRNIANEYFMRHAEANFVDLDAFVTGALVPELQGLFDAYWNDPVVFDLHSIVASPGGSAEDLAQLRAQFDRVTGPEVAPPPAPPANTDVLGYGPLSDELDAGRLGLVWASATAIADSPSRLKDLGVSYALVQLEDVETVHYNVLDMIRSARKEVVITSPYMIPGERGMVFFTEQRARGVQIKVLTNSLAATDEPLVHVGYRKYRREMLRIGIDLYELSPVRVQRASRLGMFSTSQGRLHAKTAVADRRHIFIGSMNFDPRSEKTNTEMGLFIDSPQLAREVLRLMDLDKLQASYRLMLAPDGEGLIWTASDGEGEVIFDDEPEASFATKFWLDLLAPLAPEELL